MEIPSCAVLGRRETVIVRIMDLCESCNQRAVKAWAKGSRVSYCELCSRTMSYSQRSDCDSASLRRSLHFRGARSRKVHVYAAACLLLLVGGLSPTAAAPYRKGDERKMADASKLWENPCDYGENSVPDVGKYTANMAKNVAFEARRVITQTAEYHDTFANETHSYGTLEDLLKQWESYSWFRKLSWFREEMLPEHKTFNQDAHEEFVDSLMSAKTLDSLLPHMYKGMKTIVASFHALSEIHKEERFEELKKKLEQTMHDMRYVLCQFQTVMIARNLPVHDLSPADVPDFSYRARDVVLVFRDSLNYVEYLAQVFQRMYEKDSEINP